MAVRFFGWVPDGLQQPKCTGGLLVEMMHPYFVTTAALLGNGNMTRSMLDFSLVFRIVLELEECHLVWLFPRAPFQGLLASGKPLRLVVFLGNKP